MPTWMAWRRRWASRWRLTQAHRLVCLTLADLLALRWPAVHLARMNDADPITRLNAALEGRYRIEREDPLG